jgi:glycosyltransferase involved in cell wall biosynthesis
MPGRNPLVSIVINNYNYGRFLGEAIDSALAQTYPNAEVLVVDDGSTDNSREVIEDYRDRVIPVLKENGGQASAFNAGFAASSGEIVLFLDADDYLFPETIEQVIKAWEPGVVNVQYRLKQVDTTGNSLGSFNPPRDVPMQRGEVWRTLLSRGYYRFPPTSGLAFSRAALEQVLPMPDKDYRIAADGYLAALIPFYGSVEAIEVPLGAYRVHGNNLWKQRGLEMSSERLRGFVQHDLDKMDLIRRTAEKLRHKVPVDLDSRHYASLQTRLILLRLHPQDHLIPDDTRAGLVYRGTQATWLYSSLPWRRKLRLSAWFIWVGLMPLPVAKLAITWLFDNSSRPRIVQFLRWEATVTSGETHST